MRHAKTAGLFAAMLLAGAGCLESQQGKSSTAEPDSFVVVDPGGGGEVTASPDPGALPDPGTPPKDSPWVETAPSPDVVASPDTGPGPLPPLPPCPLAFEECADVLPGCYVGGQCDNVPDCPISGCDTDGPEVAYVIFGGDMCGNGYVYLGDPTGRLGVAGVSPASAPGEAIRFKVLLDGQATTRCEIEELLTGAIRWQLICYDDAGATVYAAILEPGLSCPACPSLAGCYVPEIGGPSNFLLPQPDPELPSHLEIVDTGPCQVAIRVLQPPAEALTAWISHLGVLIMPTETQGGTMTCAFPIAEDVLGPGSCMLGTTPIELYAYLVRSDEAECPLWQCAEDTDCVDPGLGDDCLDHTCTCGVGAACVPGGTTCAVSQTGFPQCVPPELLADPRACTVDEDCQPCLVDQWLDCCDQVVDGSALAAVNVMHPCPMCCTCAGPCPSDYTPPSGVTCQAGQCTYGW